MLSEDEFATWSKDHVLFCHVTSQVDGEKYGDLLSEMGGNGFPYFAALDADGNLLAPLEGARTVAGFRSLMEKASGTVKKVMELEKRSAEGDQEARKELFFLRLELGRLDHAAAEKAAARLELTEEEQERVDAALVDLQVAEILAGMGPDSKPEQLQEAGRQFAALWRAGKVPTSDDHFQPFWILIMDHAEAVEDVSAYEHALGKMEERFGDNPRARQFFEERRATLERLKAAAAEKSSDG